MPVDTGSAGTDEEDPEDAEAAGGRGADDENDGSVPASVGVDVLAAATAKGDGGDCNDTVVVMPPSCSPPPTGAGGM